MSSGGSSGGGFTLGGGGGLREDVGGGLEGGAVDVAEAVLLVVLGHVERFVDHFGNGLDFCAQLLLDSMEGESEGRQGGEGGIPVKGGGS